MKGCKLEDGLIEINVKNEKILRKKWPRGPIKHTGIYGKSIRKQEEKGEEEKKNSCRHNDWKCTKSNGKH